jgi:hypothetical protein
MRKWPLMAIIVALFSHGSSAEIFGKREKIPVDIRAYMSILAKKGNHLTEYEKTYMEYLARGHIKEAQIDSRLFRDAFLNELDNTSEAKKFYDDAQERWIEEQREKRR